MTPGVALLGCGQWGRNIARNLAALGALRVVHDPDAEAVRTALALSPGTSVCDDLDRIFADPDVRACVIATPAALHAGLARRALDAGKDVFVEKPLALTVAEGEDLVARADERGAILMVGHLLEYHPGVERLRSLVAGGVIGKVQYIYSNRLNLGRIRTEENALWSFAPHDVYVILRLLGEDPVDVASRGGSYLSHAVADVTLSMLTFAGGVRAHVFVSWLHPYKEQKLVVVGDRSMAVFDDTLPARDQLQLYPHRVDWIDRVPVAVKVEAERVPFEEAEPLAVEMRHFLECVRERRTPRTDGPSAVAVLRVLEACQRSLERGGIPVTLSRQSAPGYVAHPTATIDPGCEIGPRTRIWHYSHVSTGARIGRDGSLGQNVYVAPGVTIGANVKIQNNVAVYEGVTLEDDVFCGPSMVFTNVINPRSHVSRKDEFRPTLVRQGATIGANATIVCGHIVGRYAFVGAGAVVLEDVPDHGLVVGNPARLVGWMCRCGVRLPLQVEGAAESGACPKCGERYVRRGPEVSSAP